LEAEGHRPATAAAPANAPARKTVRGMNGIPSRGIPHNTKNIGIPKHQISTRKRRTIINKRIARIEGCCIFITRLPFSIFN
jgi:hypothetical protein